MCAKERVPTASQAVQSCWQSMEWTPRVPASSHETQPILSTSTFQEAWPTPHTHLKQEKAASHRRCCQLPNLLEDEPSTPAKQSGSSEEMRTPLTSLSTHPTDSSAFGANCSGLRDSLTSSTSRPHASRDKEDLCPAKWDALQPFTSHYGTSGFHSFDSSLQPQCYPKS